MTILAAFQPTYGAGATQASSTTSASFACDANATKSGGGNKAIFVRNLDGTDSIFFRIGKGAQTATAADLRLGPGERIVIAKAETDDNIAILASANTPSVNFIVGEGFAVG